MPQHTAKYGASDLEYNMMDKVEDLVEPLAERLN